VTLDRDMRLLFLDFETGGLSPAEADVLEVGCVLTDPSGRDVLVEYEAKVLPARPVSPGAAAVNGYDPEAWAREAVPSGDAAEAVEAMSEGAILVCHNATFDWGFLEPFLKASGRRWLGGYHRMCTLAMAMPLHRAGVVEGVSLQKLAAYFKIDPGRAHSALADARTCREVFLKLMPAYEAAAKAVLV